MFKHTMKTYGHMNNSQNEEQGLVYQNGVDMVPSTGLSSSMNISEEERRAMLEPEIGIDEGEAELARW